ncbi:hypothetical protein KKC17_04430 [Patescibacteria group bacterium]|nr:hypothetical protein [Patescibacteria group bacterium]
MVEILSQDEINKLLNQGKEDSANSGSVDKVNPADFDEAFVQAADNITKISQEKEPEKLKGVINIIPLTEENYNQSFSILKKGGLSKLNKDDLDWLDKNKIKRTTNSEIRKALKGFMEEYKNQVGLPSVDKKTDNSSQVEPVVMDQSVVEAEPVQPVMAPEVVRADKLAVEFAKFFNIKPEELNSVPGFVDLTVGQQALLLENLKQTTLSRIKSEALDDYKKETGESKFFTKIKRNLLKKYYVAKETKVKYTKSKQGGLAEQRADMEALITIIKDSGLDATINSLGQIEVSYGGRAEDYVKVAVGGSRQELNSTDQAKLANFNKAATIFSKIPYEWSLPAASRTEQKEFSQAKKDYKQALADLLQLKKDKLGNDKEAALATKDIDYQVQMERLFKANPNIEKALKQVDSNKFWVKALGNVATERGTYFLGGLGSRALVAGALGVWAAPVVAAASGATLAWRRFKQDMAETESARRRGVDFTSKDEKNLKEKIKANKERLVRARELLEVKQLVSNVVDIDDPTHEIPQEVRELHGNILQAIEESSRLNAQLYEAGLKKADKAFVTAEQAKGKIEKLLNDYESADEEKKQELRGLLKTRIFYTKDKLDKGLIDFGANDKNLFNKYELLKYLSLAETTVVAGDSKLLVDVDGLTIEQRLKSFIKTHEDIVGSRKASKLLWQITKGAALGAGFAYLGGLVKEGAGHLFSSGSKTQDVSEIINQSSSPQFSESTLQDGAVIDALSHKYGFKIPDLQTADATTIKTQADYLRALDEAISNTKINGQSMTPELLQNFKANHPEMFAGNKVPTAEEITVRWQKDIDIATVGSGEGIEHKAIEQILDNPKKFGFDGDLTNSKAVREFANRLAHQTAIDEGYVTEQGELRLKSSAQGEQIRFVIGADGKAHYEFGQGLDSQDVYQQAPIPKTIEVEPIKTENLDWWNSEYKQGSLVETAMPAGGNSGLTAYEFLGQDGTKGSLLVDSQSHEILYSVDAADYGDDYANQVQSSYEIFNQTIDKVDKAIGEAGQNWGAADKLLVAEWSAGHTGLDKADIITTLQSAKSGRITELAEHVGSKAPQYLRDTDFGSYLSTKTNLADLSPTKANKLWEIGQTIKGNGFKSVDYRFVDKMFYSSDKNLGWTVEGDKFIADVKTPLLNKAVELPIADKSHFNESFYLDNKQIANRIALNEQVVLSKLGADFSNEEARQIMSMDVKDFKLSSLENHFGKGFLMFNNNSTIENWFHDMEPKLQGANSGTVGENLHQYFVDKKGVLASWHFKGDNVQAVEQSITPQQTVSQVEIVDKPAVVDDKINNVESVKLNSDLEKSKIAAQEAIRQAEELEARLKAQDAIEKAEKLLKEK